MAEENNIVESTEEVTEVTEEKEQAGQEITLDEVLKNFNADDILSRPELAKGIQSRIDTTVTKALNTARSKWELEKEEELDEAKKLEKMTAEQRERYTFKKEREAFQMEQKRFEQEQLKIATGKELLKRGIDASFSDYLTADNAEATKQRIEGFEKAFNEAVMQATNAKFKGKVPEDVRTSTGITKESIKKMTQEEINANWDEVSRVLAEK